MRSAQQILDPRNPLRPNEPIIPRKEWDYPPWHNWTFQHIREMTATSQVWRGEWAPSHLVEADQGLGALDFTFEGQTKSIDSFVESSFTDGIIVLQDGAVVYERYLNGMKPHTPHLCMSVTKSVVGTIAGILEDKGELDPRRLITDYVPDLSRTAYKGAKVQDVLDMTSGVEFNESYTEDGSHMMKLDLACGWKVHDRPGWPTTMWDLIMSLTEQETEHGSRFSYRSIDTDVLGLVLEHATGTALADLISRELWQPLGAQEDGYITVDHAGLALADGGFCATLRDMGRFTQMLANKGTWNGRQIVSRDWIDRTLAGTRFSDDYRMSLPNGAYSNTYWIETVGGSVLMGRGIFGQFIYADPSCGFAAVKFSTWPDFVGSNLSRETFAAFNALKAHLNGQ